MRSRKDIEIDKLIPMIMNRKVMITLTSGGKLTAIVRSWSGLYLGLENPIRHDGSQSKLDSLNSVWIKKIKVV
jgi:hypothetical protein